MLSLSIHPRHWPKTGNKKKSNTCKTPKDPKKGILGKRIANLERRRHSRDMTVNDLKSTKYDVSLAFKSPGSMKGY